MEKNRYKIVSADGLTPAEMAQAQAHVQRLNANPPTAPASEEADAKALQTLKEDFIREHYTVAVRAMNDLADGLARKTLARIAYNNGLYPELDVEAIIADLRPLYQVYEDMLNPLMKVRAAAELVLNKRIEQKQSGIELPADFDRQIKNLSYRIGHPENTRQHILDFYAEIGALALAALEKLNNQN